MYSEDVGQLTESLEGPENQNQRSYGSAKSHRRTVTEETTLLHSWTQALYGSLKNLETEDWKKCLLCPKAGVLFLIKFLPWYI